ncbi:MAG: hypothetical protein RDV48_10210 [Candidatus Eremiobacteraeota bacterium]|nr:hypothetical protein [Candidatus Eremiobacteraeota bacterium]
MNYFEKGKTPVHMKNRSIMTLVIILALFFHGGGSLRAETEILQFSSSHAGRSPEGFMCVYPGENESPHGVLTIADDKGNKVLSGLNENSDRAAKKVNPLFLALLKKSEYLDGELSTRMKIVSGRGHAEGGLVWRYRGTGDYLLFKYCATHNKVTLYSYTNGYKSRIGVKSLRNFNKKKYGAWHTLRAKAGGARLQCWFDGSPVFDIEDRTHSLPGKAGLFIGANSNACFDDIMTTLESGQHQAALKPPPGVTSWKIETIDSEWGTGNYPSLSFDRNGAPAVAYYAQASRTGRFAVRGEKAWKKDTFEITSGLEHFICLAFNRLNEPNLAFCFNGSPSGSPEAGLSPYYAYLRDSRWNTAFSFDKGKNCFISMALDRNDYPRIAYLNTETRQVKLASWNGKEWVIEAPLRLVRRPPDKGFRISLAVSSQGVPSIAYFGPQYHSMNYMEKREGKWIVEIIDRGSPGREVGEFCSMALDSRDIPHISYYDKGRQCLRYAVRKNRKWQTVTADAEPGVGLYSCIAMGANDSPIIAYYDSRGGIIRCCSLERGKWKVQKTDCQGSLFSMKVGPGGKPFIAFMDQQRKCLMIGHP